jgi:hypothetical protein
MNKIYQGKNLYIGTYEEFHKYLDFDYPDLESLEIINFHENPNIFFSFLQKIEVNKLKYINCALYFYNANFIYIKNDKKNIVKLTNICGSIDNIINNLPIYLDTLIITDPSPYSKNKIENLPVSLKNILFVYSDKNFKDVNIKMDHEIIKLCESKFYFNILFEIIKLPHGCTVEISVLDKKYQVLYDNFDASILQIKVNNLLKTIEKQTILPPPLLKVDHIFLTYEERGQFVQIMDEVLVEQIPIHK